MPTLIERARAFATTNTKGEPLFNPQPGWSPSKDRQAFETAGKGQVLGGNHLRKSTPPDSQAENVDKTPPAHAKVLPWVRDVASEADEPEGMFGPYHSLPPTRAPTMMFHDIPTVPPPTMSRSIHPFAYGHPANMPFSPFAAEEQIAPDQDYHRTGRTRESEMLSRGAGMRGLGDEKNDSGSLGIGTFGIEPSAAHEPINRGPIQRSGSPHKPSPGRGSRQPPPEPLPPSPPEKSPVTPKSKRKPPPRDTPPAVVEAAATAHVHHPHHDYPFSHEEAAKKQAEAMEAARAGALAQLEAARRSIADQPILPDGQKGQKGPRGTFQTSTSGPSFGHILHQDGMPMRIQVPPPGIHPPVGFPPSPLDDPRMSGGPGGFFRIPFGVPVSASIPRPMIVMRNSGGVGLGLGMGLGMGPESPAHERRGTPGARSAYVEDIEDEEDPSKTVKTHTKRAPSAAPSIDGTIVPDLGPARTESGIQPLRTVSKAPTAKTAARKSTSPALEIGEEQYRSAQPLDEREPIKSQRSRRDALPGTVDSPLAPAVATAKTAKTAKTTQSGLSIAANRKERGQIPSPSLHQTLDRADVNGHHHSHHFHGHPLSPPFSPAASHVPSLAPTSASNVKQLVADSKFHDETLCQLLDASRLRLIGGEARKALQRAARARVIELKDLKVRGEQEVTTPLKRDKMENQTVHKNKSSGTARQGNERSETDKPPEWAQAIMARLEAFDARFSELEKQGLAHGSPGNQAFDDAPTQDAVGQLIEELIYHDFMTPGFPPGMADFMTPGFPPTMIDVMNAQTGQPSAAIQSINTPPTGTLQGTPGAAAPLAPHIPRSRGSQQPPRDSMTWGSEVELPQPNETVSPPRPTPTINIQAPTESNVGKSSYRVPSGPSVAHAPPRAPPGMPLAQDIVFEAPGGVVDQFMPAMDRDLPPAPSESIKSNRPTPTARGVPLPDGGATQYSSPVNGTARFVSPPPGNGHSHKTGNGYPGGHVRNTDASTAYRTAPTQVRPQVESQIPRIHLAHDVAQDRKPSGEKQQIRDIIHVTDTDAAETFPDPWDLITQKLYGWAMVWDEETFVRAMERISLGEQVEDCPLTIFMMMTYKRLIRNNLCSIPQKSCDKLFIPPTIASAINAAIHGKQIENAAQILHEMWDSYRLGDTPPRVIIALARHRNETDSWTAHRFDLHSHQMTSYGISHDDTITRLKDGRPFMWWYAIRIAWPECKIPEPVEAGLQVRFETVKTAPEARKDNSLVAANTARNLLCGYRPERTADLVKMRELIWSEVKRLLHKKRTGRLIIDYDSADHVYEV